MGSMQVPASWAIQPFGEASQAAATSFSLVMPRSSHSSYLQTSNVGKALRFAVRPAPYLCMGRLPSTLKV